MNHLIDHTLLGKGFRIWLAVGLALIAASALSQFEAQNIEVEAMCDNRLSITWKGSTAYRFTPTGEGGGKVKCSDSEKKCVIEGLKPGQSYDYYLDTVGSDGGLIFGDPIRLKGASAGPCPEYIAVTPTPRPPVDTCANLPGGIVVRDYRPFSTQCQPVSRAGVGNAELIAQGILNAVDVWGNVSAEIQVCFHQQGSLYFLDAATAPRARSDLPAERIEGMTCGRINRTGTVALVPAGASVAAARSRNCGITTTGHLKLRAGPSLDDGIIGYVPRGATPNVISRGGDWLNVEYQGEAGWIGARYVGDSGDCGGPVDLAPAAAREGDSLVCTTGNLRVRSGPSIDDDIMGYVRRGTTLRLISRSGDWIEIEYRGEAGWIGARYVGDSDDCGGLVDLAPAAAREGDDSICTTGNLRVRSGPSIDNDIMGYVPRGVTLRSISRRGDWIEIEYQGEAGWIGARYVSDDCGGPVDLTSMAARQGDGPICTTGDLRVRSGSSINDDIIGYVPRGVTLRSISRNRYWVNVEYQGEVGWVGAAYVSADGDCG